MVSFFIAALTVLLLPVCGGLTANVSNVKIRRDVEGRIVNSHSGMIARFATDGLFYLYGTAYPQCVQQGPICEQSCGYYDNVFVVYTSPDLEQWTLANGNLVPAIGTDSATIEYDEVNVGYCAAKGDYVMTFWSGRYGFHDSRIALARSPTPTETFTLVDPIVAVGGKVISDTVALFVDDDGTAYVRYNTRDPPLRHIVEKLTPDWSATSGEFGVIFEKQDFPWYDGGGMFHRGDVYYVQLSFDCCFCQWGSDALVFVAPAPLGPWAPQSDKALNAIHRAAARRREQKARTGTLQTTTEVASVSTCNLSGDWCSSLGGAPLTRPTLHLQHDTATNIVTVSGAVDTVATYFPQNSSIVFNSFPGIAPTSLVGIVKAFNETASDDNCTELAWQPPYSPPGSFWCLYPTCSPPPVPPATWPNEVNFCADGKQPPVSVADMTINPCSQFDVNGVNFTIPAQQFSIATLTNSSGGPPAYLYFGERFRSTPTGNKSDDFQYWGLLQFGANGAILKMSFQDQFSLEL